MALCRALPGLCSAGVTEPLEVKIVRTTASAPPPPAPPAPEGSNGVGGGQVVFSPAGDVMYVPCAEGTWLAVVQVGLGLSVVGLGYDVPPAATSHTLIVQLS